MTTGIQTHKIPVAGGELAVHIQGDATAPVIYMAHSILSSSMMWQAQAELLASTGWRVIRADTRGHGQSTSPPGPYSMNQLAGDMVSVLDAMGIERAHYLGLSLGAMSGFGLGIHHSDRLLSLCLCDGRADMPAALGAPWDERITLAQEQGCVALSVSTPERWFGKPFLDANPAIAQQFNSTVAATQVEGFSGCARAIQGLDYLSQVSAINCPTTLIVGANDGPLPQVMQSLQNLIPGSVLEVIPNAGHLPNIDQAPTFNAALLRHLQRVSATH